MRKRVRNGSNHGRELQDVSHFCIVIQTFQMETHYLSNTQEHNPIWIGNLPDTDWENKSINNYKFPKQLNERFIDLIDG